MRKLILILLCFYCFLVATNNTYSQLYLPGNTSIGPSGDTINDLKISPKGEILYATNYGANVYDIEQNKWHNYTITNGVPDINVNTIFRDSKDNLWIGTNLGLSKINKYVTIYSATTKLETWESAPHMRSLIYKHSVYSTDPDYTPEAWGTVKKFFTNHTDVHHVYLYGTQVSTIFEDKDGRIWVGTNLGISVIENDQWTVYGYMDGIELDYINDIKQTPDGNIWIAFYYGLIKWDGNNATQYFAGKNIYDLCIDQNNHVWCGERAALHHFDGQKWNSWPIDDCSKGKRYVLSIDNDQDGNIWCGTNAGILVFDGNEWIKKYESENGMLCDTIDCLIYEKSSNIVRIGTPKGSSVLKNNFWSPTKRSQGMPSGNIQALEYDGESIWIGTDNGLSNFKLLPESSKIEASCITTANSNLCDNHINDISCKNSTLWVATDNGISKLRMQNDEQYWTTYKSDTSYSTDPEFVKDEPEYFIPSYYWREKKWTRLLDNQAYSIDFDGETTWIGSNEGISKFDGLNWKSYDKQPDGGLYHCPVTKIQATEDKTYFGSHCGISELSGDIWRYTINTSKYPYIFSSISQIGDYYQDDLRKLWYTGEGKSLYVSNIYEVKFIYTIYGDKQSITYGSLPNNLRTHNNAEPYEFVTGGDGLVAKYFDKISPLHYDSENEILYLNNYIRCKNYWYAIRDNQIITRATQSLEIEPVSYFGPYQKHKTFFTGTIQDITSDNDGNVWYATSMGLIKHQQPITTKATSVKSLDPNEDVLNIKIENGRITIENGEKDIDVTICDLMGRIVFRSKAINLRNQAPLKQGVYLVSTNNNGRVSNQRILVRE